MTNFLCVLVLQAAPQAHAVDFYRLYQVEVDVPATNSTNDPQSKADAAATLLPYLTLNAYSHPEYFDKSSASIEHSLRYFKLDLEAQVAYQPMPVSTVLMAYDIENGVETAAFGQDVLRLVPVTTRSATGYTLTVRSSAIEQNMADKFAAGLDRLNQIVGPLLSSTSVSALSTTAISVATQGLKAFQSNDQGTSDSKMLTINPSSPRDGSGLLKSATALIIVPSGSLRFSKRPWDKDYASRVKAIDDAKLTICTTEPDKLCKNDGSTFDQFAYVLVRPSVSYRLTLDSFLWPGIQQGSCQFSSTDVDTYRQGLQNERSRMTTAQYNLEREILSTAETRMTVDQAASHGEIATIFDALNKEFARTAPQGDLYKLTDAAGPSYESVQTTIRACTVDRADEVAPGIFRTYANILQSLRRASTVADTEEGGKAYEGALESLLGLQATLADSDIEDPQVNSVVNNSIKRAERGVRATRFKGPLDRVAILPRPVAATNPDIVLLRSLITSSACESCKVEALSTLTKVSPPSPQSVSVLQTALDVSSSLSEARGEAQVLQSLGSAAGVSTASDLTALKTVHEKLARAESLLEENGDSPAKISVTSADKLVQEAKATMDEIKEKN